MVSQIVYDKSYFGADGDFFKYKGDDIGDKFLMVCNREGSDVSLVKSGFVISANKLKSCKFRGLFNVEGNELKKPINFGIVDRRSDKCNYAGLSIISNEKQRLCIIFDMIYDLKFYIDILVTDALETTSLNPILDLSFEYNGKRYHNELKLKMVEHVNEEYVKTLRWRSDTIMLGTKQVLIGKEIGDNLKTDSLSLTIPDGIKFTFPTLKNHKFQVPIDPAIGKNRWIHTVDDNDPERIYNGPKCVIQAQSNYRYFTKFPGATKLVRKRQITADVKYLNYERFSKISVSDYGLYEYRKCDNVRANVSKAIDSNFNFIYGRLTNFDFSDDTSEDCPTLVCFDGKFDVYIDNYTHKLKISDLFTKNIVELVLPDAMVNIVSIVGEQEKCATMLQLLWSSSREMRVWALNVTDRLERITSFIRNLDKKINNIIKYLLEKNRPHSHWLTAVAEICMLVGELLTTSLPFVGLGLMLLGSILNVIESVREHDIGTSIAYTGLVIVLTAITGKRLGLKFFRNFAHYDLRNCELTTGLKARIKMLGRKKWSIDCGNGKFKEVDPHLEHPDKYSLELNNLDNYINSLFELYNYKITKISYTTVKSSLSDETLVFDDSPKVSSITATVFHYRTLFVTNRNDFINSSILCKLVHDITFSENTTNVSANIYVHSFDKSMNINRWELFDDNKYLIIDNPYTTTKEYINNLLTMEWLIYDSMSANSFCDENFELFDSIMPLAHHILEYNNTNNVNGFMSNGQTMQESKSMYHNIIRSMKDNPSFLSSEFIADY